MRSSASSHLTGVFVARRLLINTEANQLGFDSASQLMTTREHPTNTLSQKTTHLRGGVLCFRHRRRGIVGRLGHLRVLPLILVGLIICRQQEGGTRVGLVARKKMSRCTRPSPSELTFDKAVYGRGGTRQQVTVCSLARVGDRCATSIDTVAKLHQKQIKETSAGTACWTCPSFSERRGLSVIAP